MFEFINKKTEIAPEASKEETKNEYKFHFSEVEELKNPIETILIELEDEINSGNYKIILGDDTSGRIPALIFGSVIKSIYKEKNFEAPKIRFIPANPDIPKGPLDKKIRSFKRDLVTDKSDKILVITDTIASGQHLRPLADSFKENKIKFDVATIGVSPSSEDIIKSSKAEWGCNIVFGQIGVPNIYGKRALSGVYKEYGDTVSRSRKKIEEENEYPETYYEGSKEAQKSINMARQDVNELSRKIYEWYKNGLKLNET